MFRQRLAGGDQVATLLLRLAAPLQSWGDESKYDIRQTRREPSKSGVIGLIAAALGLRRDSDEIAELSASLRMGVRVEMPGTVIKDFHTARAPKYSSKGEIRYDKAGEIIMEKSPYVTTRYYLSDACFLVGLESPKNELISRIGEALQAPCFPLFLGRRSCPPSQPLYLGIRDCSLKESLEKEPWQASEWYRRNHPAPRLRMVLETPRGEKAWHSLRDEPVSFNPVHRKYSYRGIEPEQYVWINAGAHDPMAEL